MTEPTDQGGTPPPEPQNEPEPETAPDADPFAVLDAREEFFTGTVQSADRLVHTAEAVRLQVLLAGFEAMLLEEQEQTGSIPGFDDPIVRGFYLHQANELRTTQFDIEQRLTDARMLRKHLPATWGVLLTGGCSERAAGVAAQQAIGLAGADQYAAYDTRAAELVQTARPTMVERKLATLRDELNPDAVTGRHKTATNRRWVGTSPEGDGQAVLSIHSTAADIAAAYDRIRSHAVAAHGREEECRTLGQLMVDGAIDAILTGRMRGPAEGGPSFPMERLGETVDPTRQVIDATILVVIPATTATGASDLPAQVAGAGTIDGEVARTIVAHTRTWTRAVVDPVDDTILAFDSTERYIPAGLKKLLHLRQPTCGCGCGLPAHRADVDHATRVEHDGRTRHDNLQILCRRSHQAKDAGYATTRVEPDGRIRTKNKWGGITTITPALKIKTTYPDNPPF